MLGRIVYWLAVFCVSLALVLALILWFESRDGSRLEGADAPAAARAT